MARHEQASMWVAGEVVVPPSQVRRTLAVACLDTVFVVHMTRAEALAALEERDEPS